MDDLEDENFEGLTEEEIKELSEFLDPENELLPASERVAGQTTKNPTGPYDRKRLLAHLEEQAVKSTVGDDYVPFVKKKPPPKKETKKPAPVPVSKPLDPELNDMLAMLDEADLAELAAELGVHGMINQAQSRGDEKMVANPSTGLHSSSASYRSTSIPASAEPEVPQDTDVDEVIQRLKENDPSLTVVNLNNHSGLDSDIMVELFGALKDNVYLESLQMANVRLDENSALLLAEILATNCTLKILNLESNRITRKGIKAIMKSLADNQRTRLKELRMVNQYFAGGAGAEGEIARYLDKVRTITKLGYNFTVPSYRSKVDTLIMRNLDSERQRRTAMDY